MKRIIITLAAVLVVAHVRAEFISGNELLSKLESSNHMDRMLAMGYIAGAADTLQSAVYCPPANIQLGQIVDMVKDKLRENPATRHQSADRFVSITLSEVWPCKKPSSARGNGGSV